MPAFEAAPTELEVVGAAWEAAARCAGRQAPAAPVVRVVRAAIPNGYAGAASIGAGGLEEVRLARDADVAVLVHELAHAFTVDPAASGPAALREGRALLLERCVLAALDEPGAVRRLDAFARAAPLVDLYAWTNPPTADPGFRWGAYGASLALFQELADTIPLPELLDPANADWASLVALLDRAPPGRRDRALARIGRSSPWSDLDGDGFPLDVELAFGRDPRAPDGADAALVPHVVPGAPPRCVGLRAEGGALWVRAGADVALEGRSERELRGSAPVDGWTLVLDGDSVLARSARTEGPPHPVALEAAAGGDGPAVVGGPGVAEGGGRLVPDPGCRGPRVSWPGGDPADVAALEDALLRVAGPALVLLGDAPRPLHVAVGDGPTHVSADLRSPLRRVTSWVACAGCPGPEVPGVHLGGDLRPLVDAGEWDTLAAVAVALHAAWTAPLDRPDLGLVEALAADLAPGPIAATDLAPFDLGRWRVAARTCGWSAALAGACELPAELPVPGPVPW